MREENMIYKFLRDLFEVLEDIIFVAIIGPFFLIIDFFSKNKPEKESPGQIWLKEQKQIINKYKQEKERHK